MTDQPINDRVEEAVGQFLRISRMMSSGDLTVEQATRGCRALRATLEPEEWAAVKHEGLSRFVACGRLEG